MLVPYTSSRTSLEGMTGPCWHPPQSHLRNEGTTGGVGVKESMQSFRVPFDPGSMYRLMATMVPMLRGHEQVDSMQVAHPTSSRNMGHDQNKQQRPGRYQKYLYPVFFGSEVRTFPCRLSKGLLEQRHVFATLSNVRHRSPDGF